MLTLTALVGSGCDVTTEPDPPPQRLTFWSTWRTLAADSIARYNATSRRAQVVLQETEGSVEVVSALHKGLADLGTAQADVTYLAYRDGVSDQRYPHTGLRGVAILWPSNLLISVPKDSPVRDFSELRGKRIGVPPRQSTGAFMSRVLLDAHGMGFEDIQVRFQTEVQSQRDLNRGELDASIWAWPLVPSLLENVQNARTRLLSLSPAVSHRLRATYPFLSRVTLPGAATDGGPDPIVTVSADVLLVCREGLSEAFVYEFVKTFFNTLPELAVLHPEAALIDVRVASATPIPLHPGAARYYRERDILD